MSSKTRVNNIEMKKKYVIIKPFRFFIFVLICIMTLTFTIYGVISAGKAEAAPETKYASVVIQDGDTLWNIIETYNPNSDINIRMALYDVYSMNDITADSIRPGDVIQVPIYE